MKKTVWINVPPDEETAIKRDVKIFLEAGRVLMEPRIPANDDPEDETFPWGPD